MEEEEHYSLIGDYSPLVLIFSAASCAIIALFGTLGNLLAIVALTRSEKLRRSSTYYLVNLAISNLPVCVVAMPVMSICLVQAVIDDKVSVNRTVLRWVGVLGFICNQAELHTICILGFNRALAMTKPHIYQRLIKLNFYRPLLAVLWIYSAGLWLPLAFGWTGELKVSERDLFVIVSKQSKTARRVYLFFAFTLPLLFSVVCHAILLYKGLGLGGSSDAASRQQWRQHVTRTVLLVFLLLFLLSVPHIVVHALHEGGHFIPKPWLLVHVLFFSRYVLDPAIFVLSSTEYRRAFAEALICICPVVFSTGFMAPEQGGTLAPPCTPNTNARHKIIDLSAIDLTKLKIRQSEKIFDSLRSNKKLKNETQIEK